MDLIAKNEQQDESTKDKILSSFKKTKTVQLVTNKANPKKNEESPNNDPEGTLLFFETRKILIKNLESITYVKILSSYSFCPLFNLTNVFEKF